MFLQLLQFRPGSQKEVLGIIAGLCTSQIPFLLFNVQCQSSKQQWQDIIFLIEHAIKRISTLPMKVSLSDADNHVE